MLGGKTRLEVEQAAGELQNDGLLRFGRCHGCFDPKCWEVSGRYNMFQPGIGGRIEGYETKLGVRLVQLRVIVHCEQVSCVPWSVQGIHGGWSISIREAKLNQTLLVNDTGGARARKDESLVVFNQSDHMFRDPWRSTFKLQTGKKGIGILGVPGMGFGL